jgi:hypothetical protein
MTYQVNDHQYLLAAVSRGSYSGEYIAYRLAISVN